MLAENSQFGYSPNPSGKFVIVKGSGGAGLGDKIRALAQAMLVAMLTDRVLFVDWRDRAYGSGTENYFGQLFYFHNLAATSRLPPAKTVNPCVWQDRLDCSFDEIRGLDGHTADDWDYVKAVREYSADLSRVEFTEDAIVLWDFQQLPKLIPFLRDLNPRWKHGDLDRIVSDVLRKHLGLAPEIQSRVREIRQAEFDGRFIIGLHVRHTNESAAIRATPTLAQYRKAVRFVMRQHPDALVFLATDNRDVETWFRQRLGRERVITTDKWFPAAGEPIHKNRSCPDTLESARESLVDVFLLAACDYLITLHNSSFSILAGLLSNASSDARMVLFTRPPVSVRIIRRLWDSMRRVVRLSEIVF